MKLKKLTLFFFVITLFSFTSNAQVIGGVHLGSYKSFNDNADALFGFGVSGKFEISEKLRVGGSFSYYSKSYDVLGMKFKTSVTPFVGLLEYSFTDGSFSPYAGMDLGLYTFGVNGAGQKVTDGYLGIAPAAGFNFSFSDQVMLNFNLKYHYIFSDFDDATAFGVNAGVGYRF